MFHRLQDDFEDVSLFHIFWSRNDRGDELAKEAKTIGYIFPHIDQIRLDGGALRKTGSSDYHLI